MTPRITMAVAARVLTQLRRDHRTLVMLLVLPCAILALLWWMFRDVALGATSFDRLGPALLALIPFIVMFLVTSVTMLRERSSGTLERSHRRPGSRHPRSERVAQLVDGSASMQPFSGGIFDNREVFGVS